MTERQEVLLEAITEALERMADAQEKSIALNERHLAAYEVALAMTHERHPTLVEIDKAALASWMRPPPEPPTVVSLAEYVRGEIARQFAERDGGEP